MTAERTSVTRQVVQTPWTLCGQTCLGRVCVSVGVGVTVLMFYVCQTSPLCSVDLNSPGKWGVQVPTPTPRTKPNTLASPKQQPPFLQCDWRVEDIPRPTRRQAFLTCTDTSAQIIYKEVPTKSTPVTNLSKQEMSCLTRVIQSSCTDVNLRVPRLAHYVWLGRTNLTLYSVVSVLSVVRFLRPCLILFHGDSLPVGPLWSAVLQLVPNIMHLPHSRPRQIFGHAVDVIQHSADVMRLQILIKYGGVYIDVDQLLLRPVDDLRANHVTIGTEVQGSKCGNGLIFSEGEAEFLRLWLSNYATFNDKNWADHSTRIPFILSKGYPHLVTVVDSFFRPNFLHIRKLYKSAAFNWTLLYGLHLYARTNQKYFQLETRLDRQNCTVGEMTRYILYGRKDACFASQGSLLLK